MSVKVTVNLPNDTVDAIREIANERGVSVTQALRQVIETQRFLHEEIQQGSKVLLERPNQVTREVMLPTTPPRSPRK
jgi:hypothetical protein